MCNVAIHRLVDANRDGGSMEMEADQRRRCLSRRDAMTALHWNEHANRDIVHAYKTLHLAADLVEERVGLCSR